MAKIQRKPAVNNLTQDGSNWMTQLLDPFHDTFVQPTGFPGGGTNHTVIQRFRQSILVTSNFASNNWRANIFMSPHLFSSNTANNLSFAQATQDSSLIGNAVPIYGNPTNAGSQYLSPGQYLQGCVVNTVSETDIHVDNALLYPSSYVQTMSPAPFISGPCRVVAQAFEVVNLSSPLTIQGSVTTFRAPSCPSTGIANVYLSGATNVTQPTIECRRQGPLINSNTVQEYPDSKTWEAKDGCYVVGTLSSAENPLQCPTNELRSLTVYNAAAAPFQLNDFAIVTVGGSTFSGITLPALPSGITTPFDVNGAQFQGLASENVLRVTAIWYIEQAPTEGNITLIPGVRLCATADERAIMAALNTMRNLPTGCKVADNEAGKWWQLVAAVAKQFAVPAIAAISNVFLPGSGIPVAALGDLIKVAVQNNRKEAPASPTKAPGRKPKPTKPRPKVRPSTLRKEMARVSISRSKR